MVTDHKPLIHSILSEMESRTEAELVRLNTLGLTEARERYTSMKTQEEARGVDASWPDRWIARIDELLTEQTS